MYKIITLIVLFVICLLLLIAEIKTDDSDKKEDTIFAFSLPLVVCTAGLILMIVRSVI